MEKKRIGNKAAEKEKLCGVEKVREKGKKSTLGKIERVQEVEKTIQESPSVRAAAGEENQDGGKAATGVAGFQLGIGSGAHEEPCSHLLLCEVQSAPGLQEGNAQIILDKFAKRIFHGKSLLFPEFTKILQKEGTKGRELRFRKWEDKVSVTSP